MKQTNFKPRSQQAGFTLIELIVVIVILGIMAATALPKFMDLGADARISKMQAASGAIRSAAALTHAAWRADGAPAAGGTYNGIAVGTGGYPTFASIKEAAGLTDYLVGATGIVTPDAEHTDCAITYVPATGTVTGDDAAVVADFKLTTANCD